MAAQLNCKDAALFWQDCFRIRSSSFQILTTNPEYFASTKEEHHWFPQKSHCCHIPIGQVYLACYHKITTQGFTVIQHGATSLLATNRVDQDSGNQEL